MSWRISGRSEPSASAMSSTLRMAVVWAVFGSHVVTSAPVRAADPHLGITEYEISCMPCHGIDGRGDGPRAKSLKTAPADLTMMTKSHNGEFPTKKLIEIIDGRAIFGAHGPRDMPVWGDRYRVSAEANERASQIERRARAQIAALVAYLRTIQAK